MPPTSTPPTFVPAASVPGEPEKSKADRDPDADDPGQHGGDAEVAVRTAGAFGRRVAGTGRRGASAHVGANPIGAMYSLR